MSTMVKVDHVSMNFRINATHTTSMKEWVIAMLRGKLSYQDFFALDDVSFTIEQGDVVGIVGENGSGKSTLLKVISGIYKPTGGSAITFGRVAPMLELGSGFDYEMTGRENIFLNGALMGYNEKFLKSKYDEIVSFSELEDYIDQPIKTYSSGMLMRLAFSVATLVNPEILIVDEILAVGDERFQEKSYNRMMELMHGGTTVLMVSHYLNKIREMCTKAIWLNHGKLQMMGDATEVCDAYHSYLYD